MRGTHSRKTGTRAVNASKSGRVMHRLDECLTQPEYTEGLTVFAARSSLETQKRNLRNEYEHEETKIGTSATPNKRTKLDHESLQGAQEPMRKGGDDVLSVANSAAPNSKFETETRNTRRARCTELREGYGIPLCARTLSPRSTDRSTSLPLLPPFTRSRRVHSTEPRL